MNEALGSVQIGNKYLHTTDEACRTLGVRKTKLFDLLKNGEIKGVLLGPRRMITDESLRAFVARLMEAA